MQDKLDFSEQVALKFKNIRTSLKLQQSEVIKGIIELVKSEKIYLKGTKEKEIKFSQTILSYIELNKKGVSKERLYLLIKYYELKHNINPGYFFTDSKFVPKDIMSPVFDLGGDNLTKENYLKIIDKYKEPLQELINKFVDDLVNQKKL